MTNIRDEIGSKDPGTGAIEYMKELTAGLSERKALKVFESILGSTFNNGEDKKVKQCGYCKYPYRDRTRPNNSKTCSRECKTSIDTEERVQKEADKRLLHGIPKRKFKFEEFYNEEYSYWTNEKEMNAYFYAREGGGKGNVEEIIAARQVAELIGGKRKVTSGDYY